MKTLIAIPCMDTLPYQFSQSMLSLIKGDVSVAYKPNSLIYDARNMLSLTAIEGGFDRVLWLDSDMVFQPNTLQILHKDMDLSGSDMVTGIYFKRNGTALPVIYDQLEEPGTDESGNPVKRIHEYVDYPKDKLFPVKGCGFGCVLTSTKLLKDVWDHFGPAFNPYPWAGEDIAFCHRVNKLGYMIMCDSRIKCGHVGQYVYTEKDFLAMRGDAK